MERPVKQRIVAGLVLDLPKERPIGCEVVRDRVVVTRVWNRFPDDGLLNLPLKSTPVTLCATLALAPKKKVARSRSVQPRSGLTPVGDRPCLGVQSSDPSDCSDSEGPRNIGNVFQPTTAASVRVDTPSFTKMCAT